MALKQQAMINCLGKYTRQYFLYKDEPGMDQVKVRLRNDIHRVEQKPQEDVSDKLLQRIKDNKIGLLNPQFKPYVPVAGWPVLHLDDLVLNTMASQLDDRVWQAVRSHFDKQDIKRIHEKRGGEEVLKDFTAVHQYPTSGFNCIKTHLAESEARMQNVKAGFGFEQHFTRTLEERLRRQMPKESKFKQYNADPEFVLAKERVRRDSILYLETVKKLLEKMLQLRVRHLKSTTPINLAFVGSEKDREQAKSAGRVLQYPGGPPVQHNFKDQILTEAPHAWPGKVSSKTASGSVTLTARTHDKRGNRLLGTGGGFHKKISRLSMASRGSDSGSGSVSGEQTFVRRMFHDQEMTDRFRRRWPPVWMSLASLEQGSYMVDPHCPTKEYNQCMWPAVARRRKSLSDILETRRQWAAVRKNVSKTVDECLWREDMEKLDFYREQYATLRHLPLCKPYPTHQRQLEDLLAVARRKRQKRVIYDCELSEWYKLLVKEMHEEVGTKDEEINELLESIKVYFKMSSTTPKFGKAKLALITMSLPAFVVLQIHVQRALRFILVHVLEDPEAMLTGWLAARGLPNILLKK